MPGIFLSHSSKDKTFVTKLAIDLINRDFPVWFDSWEMDTGDSLIERIYQGIDESAVLIVVLSQNSISSRWVQKELNGALIREEQIGRRFILPIKIDESETPLKIADRIYADFAGSYLSTLEKLVSSLKKLDLQKEKVPLENQLVPLVFTNGIYLNKVFLENRINSLLSLSMPPSFRFMKRQFVLSPDEGYMLLREKLNRRLDHIADDPYYSPSLENHLWNCHKRVVMLEDKLIDGIVLIFNERAALRRTATSYSSVCHWFARFVRAEILGILWGCQTTGAADLSDYGKEYYDIFNEDTIAKIFEVDAVTKCFVVQYDNTGRNIRNHFSIYLDSTSPAVVDLKYLPERIMNYSYVLEKYVLPRMVYQFLISQSSPLIWDFENCNIALA